MKKSLLEIVKDILSDMDSEDVNSIADTVEGIQVARIVEQTFYDLVAVREIPEHKSLIKLTSLSDADFPSHFVLQDRQTKLGTVWYDVSDDNTYSYREIHWKDPEDFLRFTDRRQEDYTLVEDKTAGTKLRIANNLDPSYYTSFDDEYLIFDSFDITKSDTLLTEKTRAVAVTFPVFIIADDFVPDIDAVMFPSLVREATSRAFSMFKTADPKLEQAARRQKVHVQNDKRKTQAPSKKRNYGRP